MSYRCFGFTALQRELNRIKIIPLNALNIFTLPKCFTLKPIITAMTTFGITLLYKQMHKYITHDIQLVTHIEMRYN